VSNLDRVVWLGLIAASVYVMVSLTGLEIRAGEVRAPNMIDRMQKQNEAYSHLKVELMAVKGRLAVLEGELGLEADPRVVILRSAAKPEPTPIPRNQWVQYETSVQAIVEQANAERGR
jgi:hypothetical protein